MGCVDATGTPNFASGTKDSASPAEWGPGQSGDDSPYAGEVDGGSFGGGTPGVCTFTIPGRVERSSVRLSSAALYGHVYAGEDSVHYPQSAGVTIPRTESPCGGGALRVLTGDDPYQFTNQDALINAAAISTAVSGTTSFASGVLRGNSPFVSAPTADGQGFLFPEGDLVIDGAVVSTNAQQAVVKLKGVLYDGVPVCTAGTSTFAREQ